MSLTRTCFLLHQVNLLPQLRKHPLTDLLILSDAKLYYAYVYIDDGNIRIWKDYTSKGRQKLVTAFASIQGHRPGVRSVNAVVDWQQQSGYLVCHHTIMICLCLFFYVSDTLTHMLLSICIIPIHLLYSALPSFHPVRFHLSWLGIWTKSNLSIPFP